MQIAMHAVTALLLWLSATKAGHEWPSIYQQGTADEQNIPQGMEPCAWHGGRSIRAGEAARCRCSGDAINPWRWQRSAGARPGRYRQRLRPRARGCSEDRSDEICIDLEVPGPHPRGERTAETHLAP